LGESIPGGGKIVKRFKEKPALAVAEEYFRKGPEHYLWNSGMFVWSAATLLDCIKFFEGDVFMGLMKISQAWDTPRRDPVIAEIYPALKKISIDFAIMEPVSRYKQASRLSQSRVVAIPMELDWLDVGSWPSYAQTCPHDENGNAIAAGKCLLSDASNCLMASSEPDHLIAMMGCQDLVVIHTKNATLICPAGKAERIKDLYNEAEKQFGGEFT